MTHFSRLLVAVPGSKSKASAAELGAGEQGSWQRFLLHKSSMVCGRGGSSVLRRSCHMLRYSVFDTLSDFFCRLVCVFCATKQRLRHNVGRERGGDVGWPREGHSRGMATAARYTHTHTVGHINKQATVEQEPCSSWQLLVPAPSGSRPSRTLSSSSESKTRTELSKLSECQISDSAGSRRQQSSRAGKQQRSSAATTTKSWLGHPRHIYWKSETARMSHSIPVSVSI